MMVTSVTNQFPTFPTLCHSFNLERDDRIAYRDMAELKGSYPFTLALIANDLPSKLQLVTMDTIHYGRAVFSSYTNMHCLHTRDSRKTCKGFFVSFLKPLVFPGLILQISDNQPATKDKIKSVAMEGHVPAVYTTSQLATGWQ